MTQILLLVSGAIVLFGVLLPLSPYLLARLGRYTAYVLFAVAPVCLGLTVYQFCTHNGDWLTALLLGLSAVLVGQLRWKTPHQAQP